MATFRNTSDKKVESGNITVMPNQQWTVDDPARIEQLTTELSCQFERLETEAPQAPQQVTKPLGQSNLLSKMNRAELDAIAAGIGVDAAQYDTNTSPTEAIKAIYSPPSEQSPTQTAPRAIPILGAVSSDT